MVATNKYGSRFKSEKGYKVKIGHKDYTHVFGGADWAVVDENKSFDGPTLLLTLDLSDPYLSKLKCQYLTHLPLCSYLNCNAWEEDQLFEIIPEKKEVQVISRQIIKPDLALDEDKLPNPLPKKDVFLENLNPDEYPLDEDSYWDACDTLLGGNEFIRILQPIWLQNDEPQKCDCGKQMLFVACVGYENYEISDGIIGNMPFFLGEAALYFHFCPDCLIVKSICQSS